MFKVSFITLLILCFSLPVLAQSIPEYVLNNEFHKKLSSSSDKFTMIFADGYKMPARSHYQLKESSIQPRCICKKIDITFNGLDGATETRSITFYPNKETII